MPAMRNPRDGVARSAVRFDLGLLVEALPDAVLVADMESRIVYANATVERLLGWRAEDLVGQSLHVIQPERLHAAHDAGFGRYASTGANTLFERPIRVPGRRADGSELDLELNLSEIRDGAGRRLVVGVLRTLGERVELERSLAILPHLKATTAATARLWTALEPQLVLQTLTDVLVDDFDAALARTWLYEPESETLRMATSGGLTTRTRGSSRAVIDVRSHPYKVAAVARTRQPFVRNGLAGDPEFDQAWIASEGIAGVVCLPLVAGDRLLGVMVHFSRRPIFDEVAETISHLAAFAAAALNDAALIAHEREAREVADRARRRFELLARVSDGVATSLNPEVATQAVAAAVVPEIADWCVIDLLAEDGTLASVAQAHRDEAGVELIHELRRRYPPRREAMPPHAIHRAIETGATVSEAVSDADLEHRAVDGEHLALMHQVGIGSHVVIPLAARGHVLGAVSLVRGPERSPFDAEEVATAEDIARRAALATDNAQLYRTAQRAIELRDRFLAVASHELRTPLSVVRGHWELLSRRLRAAGHDGRAEDERSEASLRRLGQGIDQLQRLVADLLNVDWLRDGALPLDRSPVDVVLLIRDAIAGLPDDVAPGRIELDLPDGPVVGSWDSGRLSQVIANVLANALKYSPRDGRVEVSVSETPQLVRLRVTDAGIGIPTDQLEAIFQPFSRAANASAQHYPGLGLGLAISREIVGRLGGRMWAESAGEGRGSAFFVELDRGTAGVPNAAASPHAGGGA